MSRKLDIKKGDMVFIKIEPGSNAARRKEPFTLDTFDEWVTKREVTGVGRKYITVGEEKWNQTKFKVDDDYREHYTCGGSDYKLYISKQEILDEMEYNGLYDKIKSIFSSYKAYGNCELTLEQLRRIVDVINR